MKIWNVYGSEHSANLVMIGRFKDASKAFEANEIIERLTRQVDADVKAGVIDDEHTEHYSKEMHNLLGDVNVITIAPDELFQFQYEVDVELKNKDVFIRTDEIDVSAFLKVLIAKGAKVEIYCAHDYP